MNKQMKIAVKTFFHIQNNYYEQAEAYEFCDRQYDSGEWSGAAWHEMHDDQEAKTFGLIANRFGVDKVDLEIAVSEYRYNYEDNLFNSFNSIAA